MQPESLPQAQSLVAGQVMAVLILAALLTLPVSWVLLAVYKRRVIRSMAASSGKPWPAPAAAEPGAQKGAPPVFVDMAAGAVNGAAAATHAVLDRVMRQPWEAAAIYSLGGIIVACVLTGFDFTASHVGVLPVRFAVFACTEAWPVVLTIYMVAAVTRRARITTAAAYFALFIALAALGVPRSTNLTVGDIAKLWFLMNTIPTVLVLAALNRRIRAVGPLTLSFLVVLLAGPVMAMALLAGLNARLVSALSRGVSAIGFGATGLIAIIVLLGLATLGVTGWLLLAWLSRAYERKLISDQSITVDALWLLVCIQGAAFMSNDAAVWLLSAPAAFAGYKLVTTLGFARMRRHASAANNGGLRLVLLRVFALGKRSEALYDAFVARWRQIGSVQLIAGPDLATTTIEPHELLDFVRGRFARRFLSDPVAVGQRLRELDLEPDRDARYRVTDFFCTTDSWRPVLTRLVAECDVVLMDLRDFTTRRAGCVWEIKELLTTVPLERFVLLVDATTDEAYLRAIVLDAWNELPADSPNARTTSPRLRLFQMRKLDGNTLRALIGTLLSAATSPRTAAISAPPNVLRLMDAMSLGR